MGYKIIEVTWVDATCDVDNLPLDAEVRPLERRTVGYLLEETKDYIVMTFGFIHNFHKNEDACEMKSALPKAMITKLRRLK